MQEHALGEPQRKLEPDRRGGDVDAVDAEPEALDTRDQVPRLVVGSERVAEAVITERLGAIENAAAVVEHVFDVDARDHR